MSKGLSIRKISYYLPKNVQTNDQLRSLHPDWDIEKVQEKTGIFQRYIANKDETSLDLGFMACKNLFKEFDLKPQEIDALLFISQTPDYALPPSSCILQEKLCMSNDILALDINLGCSGFVNSLAVASSLLQSKAINNCLILCAETYSKFINKNDRTNKMIFSDASSACLLEKNNSSSSIGNFTFGCDGKGAKELIVEGSGARDNLERNKQELFMNGPAILLFTLSQVPILLEKTLNNNGLNLKDIDLFVFHQASKLVLDLLCEKIGIEKHKTYSNLDKKGNTVSCSIPIALKDAFLEKKLIPGNKVLIIGFGVGYSLGSTIIRW
ncbi:MAG: ketoacyl-ACP synthase III [Prochlorococcus marinus CUG1439]|uniref:3-oxoacyl-ACP synthase III family protein n=1 Tax=Prochlorococcus sp. MIT 1314 TaxID=3096220 RepID=UPI001B1D6FBD|nr:ketoacyl-ACP synthase III [Prochlorococcus sp. MIT 1314]MCR8538776.1 ketoacyl-ACP synthase III [Prochlorococcus marinus CUG1439]